MNVIIGSHNKAKVNAVKRVFKNHPVIPLSVPSDVSGQPLTNEETRQGAINRAYNCKKVKEEAICIGLEGGVTLIDQSLYLSSWGALVMEDKLYTAGGPSISLPRQFIEALHEGTELAQLMEQYTSLKDVRHHEGAVGIFTKGYMTRLDLFTHIVTLLKGQMRYAND